MCPNPNCPNSKGVNGDFCPECGTAIREVGFVESGEMIGIKKDIKKGKKPPLTPEESQRYIKGETKEEKKQRQKNEKMIKAQQKREKHQLFTEAMSEDEIKNRIYIDMDNLAMQESGTKWMKAGAMLSFNSRDQMIAAGLKAIIDQNKLMIRQNELLLREIKKLNNSKS